MTLFVLALACSPAPAPSGAPSATQPVALPPPLEGPALEPVPRASLPDVVLVSVDTLRADHLGTYGYGRPTSPFIDRLAARGVRFAHARSTSSWTLPAHTTLFTGLLSTSHNVVDDQLRLAATIPTLAELLHRRGYATAAAVSTFYVSSVYGFERGFHRFQDFGIRGKRLNRAGLARMDDAVDALIRYVETVPPERPLFLFLHTYDAHYPYDPPAPYDTLFDRASRPDDPSYRSYAYYRRHPLSDEQIAHQVAQYDESIRWIDTELARLAAALEGAGRRPRWVITADHGEEFGERGSWGHGHTLYAEQLRIPLVVSGPGLPAGVVVEQTVGLHDVAPTIAAWAGVDLGSVDGIDLGPYLAGEEGPPERPFVAETSRHVTLRYALWEGGRRLEWDLKRGGTEVFTDPWERVPSTLPAAPLQERLVELLGRPWSTRAGGALRVKGRLLQAPYGRTASLRPGQRFAVAPADAVLQLAGHPRRSIVDRTLDPFVWTGHPRPTRVRLDDDERAALEALGYVQENR